MESPRIPIVLNATLSFALGSSNQRAGGSGVVPVDGTTARRLPSGNVYLSFFLERGHKFEEVVHEVTAEGALGKEIKRKIKDGVCRELRFAIVASPAPAMPSYRMGHYLRTGRVSELATGRE